MRVAVRVVRAPLRAPFGAAWGSTEERELVLLALEDSRGLVGYGEAAPLEGYDGILVPGGFGKRGIAGMLNAIHYAREKKVPFFGICLGMQTACIEYARNVCGLKDADSSEFDPSSTLITPPFTAISNPFASAPGNGCSYSAERVRQARASCNPNTYSLPEQASPLPYTHTPQTRELNTSSPSKAQAPA